MGTNTAHSVFEARERTPTRGDWLHTPRSRCKGVLAVTRFAGLGAGHSLMTPHSWWESLGLAPALTVRMRWLRRRNKRSFRLSALPPRALRFDWTTYQTRRQAARTARGPLMVTIPAQGNGANGP